MRKSSIKSEICVCVHEPNLTMCVKKAWFSFAALNTLCKEHLLSIQHFESKSNKFDLKLQVFNQFLSYFFFNSGVRSVCVDLSVSAERCVPVPSRLERDARIIMIPQVKNHTNLSFYFCFIT